MTTNRTGRATTATLAALTATTLAGCSVTPQDIEGPAGSRFTMEVQTPPAVTYRHLVTGLRECYSDKAWKVEADFFQDVQRGRVSFGLSGVSITAWIIQLEPLGKDSTLMRVAYHDPWQKKNERGGWLTGVAEWAHGKPGHCIPADLHKPTPLDKSKTGG